MNADDRRTLLICHDGDRIGLEVLPRWLASFSTLAGVVVIHERGGRAWQRIRREVRRVGPVRFLDVLAFRLYYTLVLAAGDARWESEEVDRLVRRYPPPPDATPVLHTPSPNSREAAAFVRACATDLAIARCKTLLKKKVFAAPRLGTYVMHPGICPEYRNAHGCFWALARNDLHNVGMTLLRIDSGIDTGPVYEYFRVPPGDTEVSPLVLQKKIVLDHLDGLRSTLLEIVAGRARRLDIEGRPSAEWGQPWLSAYLRWKALSSKRKDCARATGAELS